MDTRERIAAAVEKRRIELGLSKGQMAERCGLTRQGMYTVQVGGPWSDKPGAKTIFGVARGLGWMPDWFERLSTGQDPVEADGQRPSQADVDLAARVDHMERAFDARFSSLEDRISQTDAKVDQILDVLRGRE